jgi:hypothetical protein
VKVRVVVLSAIMALAVATGASAALSRGTVTGVVKRGPITPVCVAEQPCDAPAKGVTLVFSRGAVVVARVVTDDRGRYRIRLRAGNYTVRRPGDAAIGRKLEPTDVRVYAGRVVHIDFLIDTGIR